LRVSGYPEFVYIHDLTWDVVSDMLMSWS
jgi:hypothetical protein